jgi:excinuclease ABC subunit C
MFGLPTCRRVFPRDLKKGRPCLNFHIGQWMGVCRGNVSSEEYHQSLQLAVDFIKGGALETKRILTRRMEESAEALNFEAAAKCRDRIRALEGFSERQRLVYSGVTDQDVLAFVQAGNDTALSLLRFRSEKLVDKLDFVFENTFDRDEVRREFLLRYYGDVQHDLPPLITVDDNVFDAAVLEEFLSRRAKRRVHIVSPSRGDKARLVDLARKNAAQNLSQRESRRSMREVAALDELARLLGLAAPPPRIEAYDISNIGSDVFVGAMAVFVEGKHSKKESRRFSIRGFYAPDDYACMQQMVSRRLQRALDKDDAFLPLPDLILVDGGTGHAQAAIRVLDEFALEIPVFGMVKDDRHRTRAVTAKGGEISISSVRSVFTLISHIQDTVHRSAVEYARASHKKTALEMSLTAVPGIGPKRAKALFLHFKTKKSILNADEDALCQAPGMTRAAAKALLEAVQRGDIG